MKKIISLLLVATLLFSLSVFATDTVEEYVAPVEDTMDLYAATPASKVYLFKSFDAYATAEDYITSLGDVATISNFTGARTYAATDAPDTVWTANPAASSLKFKENAFGHMGVGMKSGVSWLQFIPEETWNYLQNADESYVISMDIAADPVSKKTNYTSAQILMADAYDEENGVPFETVASENVKWMAHAITGDGATKTNIGMGYANHETGVKSRDILPGEAYTYAYAFHNAGEGKEDDNYRRIVIDTKIEQADALINRSKDAYAQGMIGKDTISGFRWLFDAANGVYISDIKIYTVKDDPASFFVKMDDTVDLPATTKSVKFKFSQPIAKKAVSPASFTVTKNGIAFNYYEVGDVTTYVDEATQEIGSEVEIIFPYGLTAGASYEITVNGTIKNEIQKLTLTNNTVSFTTAAAPTNTVSISGKAGLEGGDAITALSVGDQAKFTAKVETAADASYILLGVYDSYGTLVSYTYAKVNAGEEISLASKITEAGMSVKAFSAGNLYDLEAFSNADEAKIQ